MSGCFKQPVVRIRDKFQSEFLQKAIQYFYPAFFRLKAKFLKGKRLQAVDDKSTIHPTSVE